MLARGRTTPHEPFRIERRANHSTHARLRPDVSYFPCRLFPPSSTLRHPLLVDAYCTPQAIYASLLCCAKCRVHLPCGSVRATPYCMRAIYPVTPYYVFTSFFPFSPPVSSHVQFIAARTRDSLCKETLLFAGVQPISTQNQVSERERGGRGEGRRKRERTSNRIIKFLG